MGLGHGKDVYNGLFDIFCSTCAPLKYMMALMDIFKPLSKVLSNAVIQISFFGMARIEPRLASALCYKKLTTAAYCYENVCASYTALFTRVIIRACAYNIGDRSRGTVLCCSHLL